MPGHAWTWSFANPPAAIWPLLADTARFNEAAGLPRHEIVEKPRDDGSVEFFARAKLGPFDLRWRELPVNWIAGQWFEHRRLFANGPLRSLTARFHLAPDGQSGASGRYAIEAEPRNLLGRLLLAAGFFRNAERKFSLLARAADRFASGARSQPFPYRAPPAAPETRDRVARLVAEIEATPNGHGLARRLADLILTAPETELQRLRPLKLARDWDVAPLPAIELCLQAVRSGLLELRWDLLCPRCRGAKATALGLDRLPSGAHCPSCNVDYARDFSRNVEASFHPAPAIRRLSAGEFCLWGPMSTPHVAAQVALDPGAARDFPGSLPPGPYRFRLLAPGPVHELDWDGEGGFPGFILSEDGAVRAGAPAAPGRLRFENRSARAAIAVIESRHWVENALTADRLTALQAFRDLFSAEVLRPGDEVAIARIALLFTDLRGSTALYQRIGDARAYHLVRDHFAFLARIVRDHEGAIVKTIGDAVMAAFRRPEDALAAALAIQREIADFNRACLADARHDAPPLVIKLGLHQGPTIAVTLNDRLDYFGSTVNMAARLQGQSGGSDIVLSREMAADEAAARRLAGLPLAEDRAELKGFAAPVTFYRIGTVAGSLIT